MNRKPTLFREVFFRGWSIERDQWVYGYFASIIDFHLYPFRQDVEESNRRPMILMNDPSVDDRNLTVDNVHLESVGEYIGFEDGNGRRIFTGDIVTFENRITAEVVFNDGRFELANFSNGCEEESKREMNDNYDLVSLWKYVYVIDNVFEKGRKHDG